MTDEAPVEGDAPQKLTGVVRPVQGLGTAVVALLGLNIVGSTAAFWSNFMQLLLLQRLNAGDFVSDAALDSNDYRQQLITFVAFGIYLLTAIVFIAWMRRAYGNLRAFGYQPKHKLGWAIGSWFVPILNFFLPFQIMEEIHVISDPERDFDHYLLEQKAPPIMGAWWMAWIVTGMMNRFSASMPEDTVSELLNLTSASLWANVANIVTALLAIVVVRSATKRQTETMQRVGGNPATF